jgi:hypothetical protein
MSKDYATRARAFVGTRFRPQGRSADGLDCVGVVVAAFELDPEAIPRDYALRGNSTHVPTAVLARHFRRVPVRSLRAGDVMLMTVAPGRLHLGVRTSAGFVHAHAGIRRVVETPGMPEWPVLGAYRRRTRLRKG